MAKKFVRGITDIKQINQQDFDTNNVNDLLSDGEYNYIHRKKKDKSEEYHNLTNNLKTLSSSNTDLLTVTNYNNTTNTATLHPKHDTQKEQVIESTRNTININHGENGTTETTKVDTNPQKVLEHDNLIAGSNLTKTHTAGDNTTTLKVSDDFVNRVTSLETDVDNLQDDYVSNVETSTNYITISKLGNTVTLNELNMVNLINTKQNTLVAGDNINITDNTISATGGLTPQHVTYGTRGQSYYAFREVFGQRTTYTIEVVQGEPELTVAGPLKTQLATALSNVKTITNGAITLTYDDTDVKIITNTSPANGVEQATFTFYNI